MAVSSAMMVLLAELAKVAVTEAAKEFGKKAAAFGTDEVLDWIKNYAASRGGLSATDRKNVIRLVEEDASIYDKLVARLKPANKRGILLVGPSGAGKTSLMNEITNRTPKLISTTEEIDTRFVTLTQTLVAIHDSPGQFYRAAGEINASAYDHKPTILALVMANGFLDTIGTGSELKRPLEKPAVNLKKYLAKAKSEELNWLKVFVELVKVPKNFKVKYLILVINKLDLWFQNHADVTAHYSTGEFNEQTTAILKKLVGTRPDLPDRRRRRDERRLQTEDSAGIAFQPAGRVGLPSCSQGISHWPSGELRGVP